MTNAPHQPRHLEQHILIHKPLCTLLKYGQQHTQQIVPLQQTRKVVFRKVQVGQNGQHLYKHIRVAVYSLLQQHHQSFIVFLEACLDGGFAVGGNVVEDFEHQGVFAGNSSADDAWEEAGLVYLLVVMGVRGGCRVMGDG